MECKEGRVEAVVSPDESSGQLAVQSPLQRSSPNPPHGPTSAVSPTKRSSPLDSLPFATCPAGREIRSKLERLAFEVRFLIDKFISRGNLDWADLVCKLDSIPNDFVAARLYLTQLSRRSTVINTAKGTAKKRETETKESKKWVTRGEKVSTINCFVFGDRIVFDGPFEEISSRVERKFGSDRLLRVGFDRNAKQSRKAFERVWDEGINLGLRTYKFLCWSKSQKSQNKCYFFAQYGYGLGRININEVRGWLGNFGDAILSKYATRLGQAFCKSHATIEIPHTDTETIEDIFTEDKQYMFTDGCGEISPDLMRRIALELGREDYDTLSAIQFRWGGVKGVVAVNPKLHNKVIFRKSMKKYDVDPQVPEHRKFDVIKCASAINGALNRQFITLFHCLGVPKEAFVKLQKEYIEWLLGCDKEVLEMRRFINAHERTGDLSSIQTEIKNALLAGHPLSEPYFRKKIVNLKTAKLEALRKKARIPIDDSYTLIGVADQTGLLYHGQVYVSIRNGATEMAFTGPVVVTKNPCLHPGDVRLLDAVIIPELKHLTNVIVFPTRGPRPHPSEISGGDLDGDQFFVSWNKSLLQIQPFNAELPAEDIRGCPLPKGEREREKALRDFFFKGLFDTSVGEICNTHQAYAELSPEGAKDSVCLELAALFSKAIDADKTGAQVELDKEKYNTKRPHFMAETDPNSVHSTGVLGTLYDEATKAFEELKKTANVLGKDVTLDGDLLLDGNLEFKTEAQELFRQYRADISSILNSYRENREKEAALAKSKAFYRDQFEATSGRGYEVQLRKASAWYLIFLTWH